MVKRKSSWIQAVRHFFSTTTLHGFKYLFSKFYIDRIGWLICCCTSTCCAGLLCTVLWERFLQVPAVLELKDLQTEETSYQYMPLVAICPPADASAALLINHLILNTTTAEHARKILAQIISSDRTTVHELHQFEEILRFNNISLGRLIFDHLPSCDQFMLKCRWQDNIMMPCASLFMKELTPWGICCVMRPIEVLNSIIQPKAARFISTKKLDLALQCSDKPSQGCGFFSTFEVEETIDPMVVIPGFSYFARVRFSSVPQNTDEDLVEIDCNPNKDYSKANCLAECAAEVCGCSNPLRPSNFGETKSPPCTVTQLECLRINRNNTKCNCLPCCNIVTTDVTLELGRMDAMESALDPLYSNLSSSSTVLHVRVYISLSRLFTMNPTETWLSLLSSLGGVFNMFLGVGLFSALEISFLLFVKLPIALKHSSEITNPRASRY